MRRAVGAAVALVAALAACGGDPVRIEGATVLRPSVPGGDAVVVVPDAPAAGAAGPRPLVLYVHGLRGDERTLLTDRRAFVEALVAEGFIVAGAEAGGPAWGNAESQRAYRELYEAVVEAHEVSDVVVLSESMGGVAGLQLVATGAIPEVAAWVGVSPVTNLGWATRQEQLRDSIAAALADADLDALDPMRLSPGALDVPLVVYATDDDRVVDTHDNAKAFAARFGADLRPCAGGHVPVDCFRPADVAALVNVG